MQQIQSQLFSRVQWVEEQLMSHMLVGWRRLWLTERPCFQVFITRFSDSQRLPLHRGYHQQALPMHFIKMDMRKARNRRYEDPYSIERLFSHIWVHLFYPGSCLPYKRNVTQRNAMHHTSPAIIATLTITCITQSFMYAPNSLNAISK